MSFTKQIQQNIIPTVLILGLVFSLWAPMQAAASTRPEHVTFVFTEWKPVFYLDQNNRMRGIYAEILTELFEKKLDIQLQFELLPWKRCQHNIQTGDADITIMLPTEERLQFAAASAAPLYRFYLNIFTYKKHPKLDEIRNIQSPQDIKRLNLVPVTNLGNGWHKKNIDAYGIKTDYLAEDIQLFEYLARKRADIVIDLLVPSLHYIRKQELEDSIEITDVRFGPLDMHLMISKKSKLIDSLPEIDEAFQQLKNEGAIDRIIQRYESLDGYSQ